MNPPPMSAALDQLLEFLRSGRGFDFTGYKRPGLARRIAKRLHAVRVSTYGEYQDYLEVHPDEFALLFNTVLINVTSFFRDQATWDCLTTEIIPAIVASHAPDKPIRVWCAGVATGQEAYSVVMCFAKTLGEAAVIDRVKIYATDIDEDALNQARSGSYSASEIESVPASFRDEFFDKVGMRFVFRKDLRRIIIFGRHDLVQDAPISKVDLLTCRNTLMYFNAEAQSHILAHLRFALNEGGYLVLGRSEMILSQPAGFRPADLRLRIFSRPAEPRPGTRRAAAGGADVDDPDQTDDTARLRDASFQWSPVAQIVIDPKGILLQANRLARSTFRIGLNDLSRPLQDLEVSYRPIELRSLIDQMYVERRPVTAPLVSRREPDGENRYFDVQVVPLTTMSGSIIGASVAFNDVSRANGLQDELQRSRNELEAAHEELQSANEELETTNEELQSTNEELETTNEELQSTNEELETMNEELQSTNEELQTTNNELNQRTNEVDEVNLYLKSILAGVDSGLIAIDEDFRVRLWNHMAEEMWGLRSDEVIGQNFLTLDIGLPTDQLKQPIRSCIAGTHAVEDLVILATNRRGKKIECRVRCTALRAGRAEPATGVILHIDAIEKKES